MQLTFKYTIATVELFVFTQNFDKQEKIKNCTITEFQTIKCCTVIHVHLNKVFEKNTASKHTRLTAWG